MIRTGRSALAVFGFAYACVTPAFAQDGATKGAAAIAWIESFECPVPGQTLTVAGLETPGQIEAVKQEHRGYVQSRQEAVDLALRARAQIERENAGKREPGKRVRKALAELDSKINDLGGNVTNSLAQMALAGYVELSQVSLDAPPSRSGTHRLAPFAQYAQELQRLAAPYGPIASAVPQRFLYCLDQANSAYVAEFEAEILADARAATNAEAITPVYSPWQVPGLANASPILQQVRAIQATRREEERRAQEQLRAERDAKLKRELEAKASRELQIATRYVNFINAGRTQDAISLLTDDVYLDSPNGNARGRATVARRMREAAQESAGARMGSPVVGSGYSVYVRVSSSRGSGTMFFGFRNNLISSITLRRN